MDVTAYATAQVALPQYYNFTTDIVERWAQLRPDAMALWWMSEDGASQRFTFADMARIARKSAAFLHDSGIRKGDRVIVIMQRVPQWWFAMLGLIRLGAVPVPGTPLLTSSDITHRVQFSQAVAIITDVDNVSRMPELSCTKILAGASLPGWIDFDHGVGQAREDMPAEPTLSSDAGIVYFTSGTSGEAKMVLHTQVSYGLAHAITGGSWLDLGPDDLIWALADTGWGKTSWSGMYGPWLMGACVFVLDMRGKFDPSVVLRHLAEVPITVFCAPATALRLLVRKDLHLYSFKHLRHCVSAGETLNVPVYESWLNGTHLHIYEGYGQTELVCCVANVRSRNEPIKPGSMGKATPGFDVRIVDNLGQPLPSGKEGNIAIAVHPHRPVGMFQEYWKNPKETADRFVNGFYMTGDTGRYDAEGYFWFCGRSDDVINSSSYRIGPSEVEDAVISHPSVLECAAIGVPDELRGEVVKVFVVLRSGFSPSDHLRKEIQAHCKKVTAPYKYPRQVEFIDALPKTVSGKTRRVALRCLEIERLKDAAGGR